MKKVKRKRNLLMEANSINHGLSEVSKMKAKITGKYCCPSNECSFTCDPEVTYLLKEHIKSSHSDHDKIIADCSGTIIKKKDKYILELEGLIYLLINTDTKDAMR
jgi:hypothetical protein